MSATSRTIQAAPTVGQLAPGPTPESHVLVLFGATGDLSKRELLPGLYHLHRVGLLPARFKAIGSAPVVGAPTREQFLEHARRAIDQFARSKPTADEWDSFQELLDFAPAAPSDPARLVRAVRAAERRIGGKVRRLFHLASARALNQTVHANFDEQRVYLFAHSGLSIAMGNADPQVCRAARHTTKTNDQDGFADAVEQLVLPHATRDGAPSEKAKPMNPAQRLHAAGQSLWLDSINRRMLKERTLAHYIKDLAVTGLTSNPTILGHAMAASSDYDDSLRKALRAGVDKPEDLVYECALEDLTAAADLFRPVFERTGGVDGYVSLEVPPGLAYDAPGSIAMARELHKKAGRPNLLVKIPGTPAGLTAMETLIADGVGINVTLLFSDTHYLQTAEAYMRALEQRAAAGQPLDVPSVASLFISRWDKAADPLLPVDLHGRIGLAVANKAYGAYRQVLDSDRWTALAAKGAHPQRVLWASTSTKDPTFPDTYYVGHLATPNTIDTVPEKTLLAFADHGGPVELMAPDYPAAEALLAKVATSGIDTAALGQSLQDHGAHRFEADWAALLQAIDAKANALKVS